MKKKLPFHRPLISSFPYYGVVFSITDITDDNLAWFINNFSYFHVTEDKSDKAIQKIEGSFSALAYRLYGDISSYQNFWGIKTHSVSRKFFSRYFSDFTSFCSNMIQEENYIFTFLNIKYIPEYNCDEPKLHPVLISGFDDEKEIFYVSYFEAWIVKNIRIPYQILEKCYWDTEIEGLASEYYTKDIILYRKETHSLKKCTIERTIAAIMEAIEWLFNPKYYKGIPASEAKCNYIGIDAQYYLCDYLQNCSVAYTRGEYYKWLRFIIEHKRIMKLGIDYLAKHKCISLHDKENYEIICNQYEAILNKYVHGVSSQYSNDHILLYNEIQKQIFELKKLTDEESQFYLKLIRSQIFDCL